MNKNLSSVVLQDARDSSLARTQNTLILDTRVRKGMDHISNENSSGQLRGQRLFQCIHSQKYEAIHCEPT